MRRVVLACLFVLPTGCAVTGRHAEVHCAASLPRVPPVGVVFVANGSGDFRTVSTNLAEAAVETCVPLQVEPVVWSHGYLRYLVDHVDHGNHIEQGRRLAAHVMALRQTCPGAPIYFVGHSAGSAVVLAAAEALPPDSVNRIVLLAPSVCVSYDLRPALCAAHDGIDVFHSGEDRVILGLGMKLIGTADHCCRIAAGQCGFTPVIAGPADAALYSKLRQHPWSACLAWSGNDGGHYGSNGKAFLRAYVLPLLTRERS